MRATLTLDDYFLIPWEERGEFDRWLEDAVGIPLERALVIEVTLGEGQITCLRAKTDDEGKLLVDGNEVVRFSSTHRVSSLPPVWSS